MIPAAKSYIRQVEMETPVPVEDFGQNRVNPDDEQELSSTELERSNTNTTSASNRLQPFVVGVVVGVVVTLCVAVDVGVVV